MGAYVYWQASSATDTTGIADGLGVAYLAGAVGSALLLATLGATAWVLGDLAEGRPGRY